MTKETLRTAFLISGRGSTVEAVLQACRDQQLTGVVPVVVVTSNPETPFWSKAEEYEVALKTVRRKDYPDPAAFGKALLDIFDSHKTNFVSQNGWVLRTPPNVIKEYDGRIINQHPARTPEFGGQGMIGAAAVCASIAYYWLTGEASYVEATEHFVTEKYDEGEIIQTMRLELSPPESKATIDGLRSQPKALIAATKKAQEKLLPLEHKNVIGTLKRFGSGETITGFEHDDEIATEEGEEHLLFEAKELAKDLAKQKLL